jgi:hypothetical protein
MYILFFNLLYYYNFYYLFFTTISIDIELIDLIE